MNSPDHQGNSANDAAAQPGAWLRDVFLHSPDMIIILDRAGVIREANEVFQTFCGLSRAAFVGKKITEFIPADGHEQWTHNLSKLTSAEWTSVDGALLSGQGRAIPFQITLVAHSLHDGRPVVILHFRDVSVYQTVARALVASQGQWERSFDAIADYMCLLDRSGRILRANHAMTQRLAPLYGNLVGRDHRAIFGAANEAKQGATVSHAVEAAPFIIPAIELPRLKGYFTVSAFPLKDEHEAVSGAVLIVRDITAERATQEALKKAEANQHQTCKMEALGRLAGSIAHDFNNMLTSVLGYSALLLKTTRPDDPQRKEIQEIISAAERAAALTRQLLDFSRDESIETKTVSLNYVIRNMEELLRHTLGEKIKLTMRLDADLSNIKADVSRLEQVVINIVMNARDAMPNGGEFGIETHRRSLEQNFCVTHPSLAPGHYAILEMSDTGCGMTSEVLEHLFEPFFTTKAKGKGTGLGLTTTYGIVKQFGGHITVYSEVGRGTTFKVFFPESAEAAEPGAPARPKAALLRGHETILAVDDDANIVTMIRKVLTELGYNVISTTSPREALALSDGHAKAIDMVLTDVIMPDLNGNELVRLLRRKRPALKTLYMSGYASQAAAQISALDVNTAFLPKPFGPESLTSCIRKVLDAPVK